ncbi:alpha/beta fold hydrolase, partial [Novosphingobium album (ex Liu et al. 2023)]|uniref:alpha/beta fold hydrolase n=1 Tax=Novosphingobium album (ex Liu et al. 2023) TaxID=3031130 RepID=UPI003D16E02E
MEEFARAVEAVRKDAGVDRLLLVGHSMGSYVVREYAERYPARTSAIIALDGIVDGAARTLPQRARALLVGDAERADRLRFIQSMFVDETPKHIRRHVVKMMMCQRRSDSKPAGRSKSRPLLM